MDRGLSPPGPFFPPTGRGSDLKVLRLLFLFIRRWSTLTAPFPSPAANFFRCSTSGKLRTPWSAPPVSPRKGLTSASLPLFPQHMAHSRFLVASVYPDQVPPGDASCVYYIRLSFCNPCFVRMCFPFCSSLPRLPFPSSRLVPPPFPQFGVLQPYPLFPGTTVPFDSVAFTSGVSGLAPSTHGLFRRQFNCPGAGFFMFPTVFFFFFVYFFWSNEVSFSVLLRRSYASGGPPGHLACFLLAFQLSITHLLLWLNCGRSIVSSAGLGVGRPHTSVQSSYFLFYRFGVALVRDVFPPLIFLSLCVLGPGFLASLQNSPGRLHFFFCFAEKSFSCAFDRLRQFLYVSSSGFFGRSQGRSS